MQKLVVLSGYPRSGKSTIARFMRKELGFSVVSMDQARCDVHGMPFPMLLEYHGNGDPQNPKFLRKEAEVCDRVQRQKLVLLNQGADVVVDSCAIDNDARWTLIQPSYSELFCDRALDRYLAVLDVRRDELLKRAARSEYNLGFYKVWDTVYEMPDHYLFNSNGGAGRYLRFENNTPMDLHRAQQALKKLFGVSL